MKYKKPASSATVIIEKNNKLLLVKRKHHPFKDMYCFPGGYLDCDKETLERTAQRELKEETNLEIEQDNLKLLCVNSSPTRDPRGHVIDHVYIAKKFKGKAIAGDDAAEFKWIDISEIPELAFDHSKVFKLYLKRKHT